MSFRDDCDDIRDPRLLDHEREPGRNEVEPFRPLGHSAPMTDLLPALSALHLAEYALSREPDALDLRVDFILARIRYDGVIWEAKRREREMGRRAASG